MCVFKYLGIGIEGAGNIILHTYVNIYTSGTLVVSLLKLVTTPKDWISKLVICILKITESHEKII